MRGQKLRPLWRLKSISLCIASLVVLALTGASTASAATAPVLSGSYSDSTSVSGATSTAISGHYAYTTSYGSGELTAIDISNPAAPVVAGSSSASNNLLNASTVNISGGIAYVVSKNRNGPCQPGPAPSMCGSGSNDDGSGNSLTLLDVSTNPATPTIMGTIRDPVKLFGAYGVAVSGNYAYVAAQGCLGGQPCPNSSVGNAFDVIDVSNPASPRIVSTLHSTTLLDHADGVTVAGNYAYVSASYSHTLTIVDISSPTAAHIVGHLTDSTNVSFPVDTAIKGRYAYVGNQSASLPQLAVVDVSNPTSPTLVRTLTDSTHLSGTYRLRQRGNFIYAAAVNVATVSAIDISNPTSPRLAGSLTDAAHLNRTTGLDVDPTGKYVVANSPSLSTQGNQTYPPFTPSTGTISMVSLDPQPIGVTIAPGSEPPNPTTQTSAQFSFSATDAVASMACQLDGGASAPCTTASSQSYSSLPPGAHTFTVTATDAAGNTASGSYTWTIQAAPVNTVAPAITGTAAVGQTLTASNGSWSGNPAPTFTYQWSDCNSAGVSCSAISGANSASYVVQSSDIGSTLEVAVTATNSAGSASASSNPTGVVGGAGPVNTSSPVITGSAVEGQTLTASAGSWSGNPTFAYQWADCNSAGASCTAISGATSAGYMAGAGDVGSTLVVTVTATNSAGSTPASSNPTGVVASAAGPVTSLLDNFNRADNSGPPSASWSHVTALSTTTSNNLLISGQQAAGTSGGNADYWNPQTFGPDSEAWVTVATKPTVNGDVIPLGVRFTNPGVASSTGYQAYYTYHSGSPDQYKISVRVNGSVTATVGTVTGPSLQAGDTLLFRAIGSTLELWRETGGVWTRLVSGNNTTIKGAGYLVLGVRDSTARLDDFGGGTLP